MKPQQQSYILDGTTHQYLLISGNYSSWAHTDYKGSVHQDPNNIKASFTSTISNDDKLIRHFLFESKDIMEKMNRVGIKKVISGDNHTLILLNDGTAYGNGWNEYCQLLTKKIAPKSKIRDQLVKADLENIEDIYCGANFTYCLVKTENGFEMYSAGWNNDDCCSQGHYSDSYRNIGRVFYMKGKKKDKFPPPNDSILDVRCGGSNIVILTFNHIERRYYLYYSGTINSQLSGHNEKIGFLKRTALPKGIQFCRLSMISTRIFIHSETCTYNEKGEPEYKEYDQLNLKYGITRRGDLVVLNENCIRQNNTFKAFTLRNMMLALTDDGRIYREYSPNEPLVELNFLPFLSESDRFKYEHDRSYFNVSITAGEKAGFILIKRSEESGKIFKDKLLKQVSCTNPFFDCLIIID